MLVKPESIRTDQEVEVYNAEYKFIIDKLAGLVFHRTDEEGRRWVKPASSKACEYLMQVLEQPRPEVTP